MYLPDLYLPESSKACLLRLYLAKEFINEIDHFEPVTFPSPNPIVVLKESLTKWCNLRLAHSSIHSLVTGVA